MKALFILSHFCVVLLMMTSGLRAEPSDLGLLLHVNGEELILLSITDEISGLGGERYFEKTIKLSLPRSISLEVRPAEGVFWDYYKMVSVKRGDTALREMREGMSHNRMDLSIIGEDKNPITTGHVLIFLTSQAQKEEEKTYLIHLIFKEEERK